MKTGTLEKNFFLQIIYHFIGRTLQTSFYSAVQSLHAAFECENWNFANYSTNLYSNSNWI